MLLSTFLMFDIFHIFQIIFIIWRSTSAPWWNGAPLMPSFKPQTYSPAAELPQIAQSKLFKFQFGGNVKIENKINTKRTLFSCVSIVCIHFGKLPRNYCCREFAIYCLKLFQIASTLFKESTVNIVNIVNIVNTVNIMNTVNIVNIVNTLNSVNFQHCHLSQLNIASLSACVNF